MVVPYMVANLWQNPAVLFVECNYLDTLFVYEELICIRVSAQVFPV